MKNFALTGIAGYIAPRHLKAIRDTGNRLVATVDPYDSVGIIDSFYPEASYFKEVERFDRHLEKLRRSSHEESIDYLSICSPNYLHDAHVRLALRVGAHAICEKPLVMNPWNLDILQELEMEYERRVWTILQLRLHPDLIELKNQIDLDNRTNGHRRQVKLTYITSRGLWYKYSWKGDSEKSGGIATNIGIHFFDMLIWLFGRPQYVELHVRKKNRMAGFLELPGADVEWFLSLHDQDLPTPREMGTRTYRSISVDGKEIEFSGGFTDLHTRVYDETLAGNGFGIEDARPSIELVHRLRKMKLNKKPSDMWHPTAVQLMQAL